MCVSCAMCNATSRLQEALCFTSYDYERDVKLAQQTTHLVKSYTLPDGRVIQVPHSTPPSLIPSRCQRRGWWHHGRSQQHRTGTFRCDSQVIWTDVGSGRRQVGAERFMAPEALFRPELVRTTNPHRARRFGVSQPEVPTA
jgi:hypothetical protein